MTGKILALIMALCGEDKQCLSQAVVYEPAPTTNKQAALLVEAIKQRKSMLSNYGSQERVVAQPMFECMIRRQELEPFEGKCWNEVWDADRKKREKRK